ncbi:MAG: helix-turn-helix domain-containing protein [Myxococcales bacterium]
MPPRRPKTSDAATATTERPGRGRPRTIDTEAILEVARAVFLEHGVRATTLEVAQRAGVSEGAVFHRFKTKDALFRAAMRFDELEAPRLYFEALQQMHGLEVHDALAQLGEKILEIGKVALPLMMMSWSNPELSKGSPLPHKNRAHFERAVKEFAAYCEAQVETGKLRPLDPEVFARAFIGALHNYGMHRVLFGEHTLPQGMFLRGLIDLLLSGALPRAAEAQPRALPGRQPRR